MLLVATGYLCSLYRQIIKQSSQPASQLATTTISGTVYLYLCLHYLDPQYLIARVH